MIINKKIYNERVARQVFIFISNTNNESKNFLGSIDQLPSHSLYLGAGHNREKTR
jgi:hypothetical protein